MDEFYSFDWSALAFGSKKPVNNLAATFIAAPREISELRFKQLIKDLLPKGNILLGISKDKYVDGFENQSQFKMLQLQSLSTVIQQINRSNSRYKIYTISYFQRETKYLLEKLKFSKALFINGSWKYAFHNLDIYYALVSQKTNYELITPFASSEEAKIYETKTTKIISNKLKFSIGSFTKSHMLEKANQAAMYSYDYNFQTGAILGIKETSSSGKYKYLDFSFNKVVPFQTYAMHFGASRELNFSPPNDLNYYDTVHAEVMMIIKCQKQRLSLAGSTLFINLLPCPTCARMLCETEIKEFIYGFDHSEGYALKFMEAAGKKVTRLVI